MALTSAQIMSTYPLIQDDPDLSTYIELAALQTGKTWYGDRYTLAVALRAAHNLCLSKPDLYSGLMAEVQIGGITSKSQGDRKSGYGASAGGGGYGKTNASDRNLIITPYGKQLLELMRMSNVTMGVIGEL